jgi:hypothetical protein
MSHRERARVVVWAIPGSRDWEIPSRHKSTCYKRELSDGEKKFLTLRDLRTGCLESRDDAKGGNPKWNAGRPT